MPSCDLDRHHYSNATAFAFALPAADSCQIYHYTGPDPDDVDFPAANVSAMYCNLDSFDKTTVETCSEHVYDESVYGRSFAMDADLAPCSDLADWFLNVSLTRLRDVINNAR